MTPCTRRNALKAPETLSAFNLPRFWIPLELHFLCSLFVQCHSVRSNSLRAFFARFSKIFKSPRALSWQTRCHRAHVCIYMRGKTNCVSSLRVPHFLRESSSLLVDLSSVKPIFSKRYPNLIKTDIATPILKQARWRMLRSTWIIL